MGEMPAKYLIYIINLTRHFAVEFYISPFSTDSFCADDITENSFSVILKFDNKPVLS